MTSSQEYLGEKRILVTGGAGFIGSALIRRLSKSKNLHVVNIDRLSYASDLRSIEKTGVETKRIDLCDLYNLREAVKEIQPDLVFHLAAESHVDNSIAGPKAFVESNVLGTFNLLQCALEHYNCLDKDRQANFKFVHISTDEVF